MNPSDYLLSVPELDWGVVLAEWHWCVPAGASPLYVTCFGDLFLETDSVVGLLDLEDGTFETYCEQNVSVVDVLRGDSEVDMLLYTKLVNELVNADGHLAKGRCYHFKLPTVLGGEFDRSNVGTNSIGERVRFCGDIHRQIKDLPDGSSVCFDFTEE